MFASGKGRTAEICRPASWVLAAAAVLLLICDLHLKTLIEKSRVDLASTHGDITMIRALERIYPAVLDEMAVASTSNRAMYELFVALGYDLVPTTVETPMAPEGGYDAP